jgi:thioredoxin-related protein
MKKICVSRQWVFVGCALFLSASLLAQQPAPQPITLSITPQPFPGVPGSQEASKFEWLTDLDQAMEQAKKRDLPVMVVFSGSDWCGWCKRLDQEVFQQQEFQDYARSRVISVMLDTPRSQLSNKPHKAIMEKYGVEGFPSVILLDKEGTQIGKGGYVRGGPSAFISQVLKGTMVATPKRAALTRSVKFDRSPSAILRVMQQQMEATRAGKEISDDDRFVMDVTLGNWPAVKEYLRSLPEANAEKLFVQLLTDLRESRTVRSSDSSTRKQKSSMISLDDFFTLCEFYPGKNLAMHTVLLAELLKVILESGDYRTSLMETLEKGTPHFGGTDPKTRMAAVNLLFAMGMKLEGGKFLPPAELSKKNGDINTLRMRIMYLDEKARVEKNGSALLEAWDLSQWILLNTSNNAEKQEAFSLTLSLLPLLEGPAAQAWFKSVFQENPLLGMKFLTTLGDSLLQNANGGGLKQREQRMALLARSVQALLDIAPDQSWNKTLNALALCWAREAEVSIENYRKPRKNTRYGGMYIPPSERQPSSTFVPVNVVLAASPEGKWFERLEKDNQVQVLTLKARLCMKTEEMEPAKKLIDQLAKDNPKQCTTLFNDYLRAWSVLANNTPSEMDPEMQERMRYHSMYGMQNRVGAEGIPLTRARQVRNLQYLATLLKDIQRLTLEPVSGATAVTVFTECHSTAEVFLREDMENVFGPFEKMSAEVRVQLIAGMRSRLADSWRKIETQAGAKTNRSELQMIAEVTRGYRILQALIQSSEKDNDDWKYHRLKAMALYDSAEYYYSLRDKELPNTADKYTLAEYTRQRDEGLKSFAKSALCYSKVAPELHPAEHSVLVYLHWFYVTLGASDLAHLKRSTDYNLDYLADIRKAIDLLPAELKEKHLQLLSEAILSASSQVGPDVKTRFLSASLSLLGDHPASRPVKKFLDYYAELQGELKLKVSVDAEQPTSVVGSTKSFGLLIELEHTSNIERESGGFGRYLQGANQNYYGRPSPVDFREAFRKYITDALKKQFEIASLVFATPSVKSRPTARANWNVTPLAYVLLKVKDQSVDAIPPIQMDMVFADTQGSVVLPLLSDILPIDARTEPAATPVKDLVITQVLDDRDLAKGKLKLQIDAAANGLIPAFEELFDLQLEKLVLEGKLADSDRGLVIEKIETDASRISPVCQRSWELTFVMPKEQVVVFSFPVIKKLFKEAKVTNKRYEEADIVEAPARVTITVAQVATRFYLYGIAGVLVAALVIGLLFRLRKAPVAEVVAHRLPETLTAFTLSNYLRHLEADATLALSEKERQALHQDIERVEKAYFSPDTQSEQSAKPDLQQILANYKRGVDGAH